MSGLGGGLPILSPGGGGGGSPEGFFQKIMRSIQTSLDGALPASTDYYEYDNEDEDEDDVPRNEHDRPVIDEDDAALLHSMRKSPLQKIGNNDILLEVGGEKVIVCHGETPLLQFCRMLEYQRRTTGEFVRRVDGSSLDVAGEDDDEEGEDDDYEEDDDSDESGEDDEGEGSGPEDRAVSPSSVEQGRARRKTASRVHPAVSASRETTEVRADDARKTSEPDDGVPWHAIFDPAIVQLYYTWMALKTTDFTLMYQLERLLGRRESSLPPSSSASFPTSPVNPFHDDDGVGGPVSSAPGTPSLLQNHRRRMGGPQSSNGQTTLEDVRELMETWIRNFNMMYEHNIRLYSLPSICKQVVQSVHQWNNLHPNERAPPVPREQVKDLLDTISEIERFQRQFIEAYTDRIDPETRVVDQ